MIKGNLKKKLERLEGVWVNKLPMVLWAHRTTPKEATEETPFSLVLGTEVVIPVKVGLPSYRVENYTESKNNVALLENLDFLEERSDRILQLQGPTTVIPPKGLGLEEGLPKYLRT